MNDPKADSIASKLEEINQTFGVIKYSITQGENENAAKFARYLIELHNDLFTRAGIEDPQLQLAVMSCFIQLSNNIKSGNQAKALLQIDLAREFSKQCAQDLLQ